MDIITAKRGLLARAFPPRQGSLHQESMVNVKIGNPDEYLDLIISNSTTDKYPIIMANKKGVILH